MWKKAEVSSLTGPEKYAGAATRSPFCSRLRSCSFAVATVVTAAAVVQLVSQNSEADYVFSGSIIWRKKKAPWIEGSWRIVCFARMIDNGYFVFGKVK